MRKLLLSPDFPDHVLWEMSEQGGPIAPEDLYLSSEMCDILAEFYRWWSEIYMTDDYTNDATAKIDWGLFDVRGLEIWNGLRKELSGRCEVIFYSRRYAERFDDPVKLDELLQNDHIA